jgi:hypothetical protein
MVKRSCTRRDKSKLKCLHRELPVTDSKEKQPIRDTLSTVHEALAHGGSFMTSQRIGRVSPAVISRQRLCCDARRSHPSRRLVFWNCRERSLSVEVQRAMRHAAPHCLLIDRKERAMITCNSKGLAFALLQWQYTMFLRSHL